MSIRYLAAEDEVFGVVNAAFVGALAALGLAYVPAINFPGQLVAPPNVNQIYAECSFSVVTEHQASLSRVAGVSIYETVALLAVQIYSPKTDASALRIAKIIAMAVRDAFRLPSPSGEVWFKDQKLSPVAGSDTKNQINVVVTCTYKTKK